MRAILRAVADLLEQVQILDPDAAVQGYIGDQLITFEMKTKTDGSMTLKWTEASVPVHGGLHLILSIRPATSHDQREVKRGLATDHEVGNPLFDAAFIVEGAPERLVRELVDEEVQRGLLALKPDHVLTSQGALTIQMPDWVEDAGRAAVLVRTTARLGAVAAEIARRHRADVGPMETSGYRGEIGQGTRSRDAQEIRELERSMERRGAERKKGAIRLAVLIAGVLGVLAGLALLLLTR